MTRLDPTPPLAGSVAHPKRSFRLPAELGPLAGLVVLVAIIGFARPGFLDQANLLSLLETAAYPGMLAIGMVFVLALREIDLSVGWMFHLAALLTAFLLAAGINPWLAAFAGVLLGAGLGLVNGLLVVALRLPAIVVTLGTFAMFRGLAAVAVKMQTSAPADQSGELSQIVHGKMFGAVPTAVFVFVAMAVVMQFVLHRSRFGYRVQAVGSNPQAALYAGIPTGAVRLQTLVLMGIVSGLAGVLWPGFPVTDADQGGGFELMAIAAAIIGGTSLSGGRGTVIGAVIGMLIVQVILSGVTLLGIDATWNPFVIGAVMLLALALDRLVKALRQRQAVRFQENLHA
ncbi:ABC transporter permease [Mesorhizobium neociceri]|uniref:Autoinducer 2 import system permease protein LsrC n=1 Tax=Mesorhizobium neociceri TaxID=1307853 RepID=A0A838B6A8_9HYPH|nr:ABC transporter permease [Mesorhizobium neociceri]MBA1141531.1 ABC transporter permease [Mesorhizobium neociceri]